MFIYILAQNYEPIAVFRSNSKQFLWLGTLSGYEIDDRLNPQKVFIDFEMLKQMLVSRLVDCERKVVLPPPFVGRMGDLSEPIFRKFLGVTYTFYRTAEDNELLFLVDTFAELEKYVADERWIVIFAGRTHREFQEFMDQIRPN